MSGVFVYWDNSNIFSEAQRIASEREGTAGGRYVELFIGTIKPYL